MLECGLCVSNCYSSLSTLVVPTLDPPLEVPPPTPPNHQPMAFIHDGVQVINIVDFCCMMKTMMDCGPPSYNPILARLKFDQPIRVCRTHHTQAGS